MARVHSPSAHTHRADGPAVLDLIERLEKADRGSRELDAWVWCAFNDAVPHRLTDSDRALIYVPRSGKGMRRESSFDFVTTSLDAALALAERVLPGLAWSMGQNVHHRHWIAYALGLDAGGLPVEPTHGSAPTPALALCIAVLRATTPAEADAVGMEAEGRNAPLQSPETPEGREERS